MKDLIEAIGRIALGWKDWSESSGLRAGDPIMMLDFEDSKEIEDL